MKSRGHRKTQSLSVLPMLPPIKEEKFFEGGGIKEVSEDGASDKLNNHTEDEYESDDTDESNKDVWMRVTLDINL